MNNNNSKPEEINSNKDKIINYYENNQIKEILSFNDNVLEGLSQFFDEEGNLIFEINFRDGKIDGGLKMYNKKNLIMDFIFENGELNGGCKVFSETDNNLFQLNNYKNGKLNNKSMYYNSENGKITKEINYNIGIINGESITYYDNGNIFEKCNYKDGKIDGILKRFYLNKITMEESEYKMGKIIKQKKFDAKGNEIKDESITNVNKPKNFIKNLFAKKNK